METEGKGCSDLYRNTSEELFLKSLMENTVGMPTPTMEMMGFKNLSESFRTDSEELFKSWLTNGECHGHDSSSIVHRTRQASCRISTEPNNNQTGTVLQKEKDNDILSSQTSPKGDEISASGNLNQHSIRNTVERGVQASNIYLAKAWFHSSQPMTRSRSSELRRRYAAMQTAQATFDIEALQNTSMCRASQLEAEFTKPDNFTNVPMSENPNQMGVFTSPSNSSSSTPDGDKVSSVVSMLKGTLERKKLSDQVNKECAAEYSNGLRQAQEVTANTTISKGNGFSFQGHASFQELSTVQGSNPGVVRTSQGPVDVDIEGFVNLTSTLQLCTNSREPSQSESSTAAPAISSGFDACDGPSICESSRRQIGIFQSLENGSTSKDIRERIMDNLKDDRKRQGLVSYGSLTSVNSVDKVNTTKKRRVERSRKMAEAKERNLTPTIPQDMRAVLKRCENLEKEVRSLKLNLSFMNRKDSEQTKHIEELQKQNEELADEKERLLEEIERIISGAGNM